MIFLEPCFSPLQSYFHQPIPCPAEILLSFYTSNAVEGITRMFQQRVKDCLPCSTLLRMPVSSNVLRMLLTDCGAAPGLMTSRLHLADCYSPTSLLALHLLDNRSTTSLYSQQAAAHLLALTNQLAAVTAAGSDFATDYFRQLGSSLVSGSRVASKMAPAGAGLGLARYHPYM
jgi:hypothetical protein